MIKIVTDTTCDLPESWLQRHAITRIPINIQFGLETFRENVTINAETFYRRIQLEQQLPTTSQPSVGEFCELYEQLAADGSQILSIHVTSKLSGTWQAASLAAKQLQERVEVRVVDSLTGSVGLGLMVHEAARLVEGGWAVNEIARQLEGRPAQITELFMLRDLRHARMSGRVGRLRETLVSLLNIKPIVGVEAGALVVVDRVRGAGKGVARMLDLAEAAAAGAPVYVGVVHALAPAEAESLLAHLQNRLNCRETFITDLALSLAVHFGPGLLGFATYPADGG